MYNRKVIGIRIRNLRLKKGWNQDDLAQAAGISTKYLGELERAVKSGTLENLETIAAALDTTLSELLAYSEQLGQIEQSHTLIEIVDMLSKRTVDEQKSVSDIIEIVLKTFDQKK
ncbi:helix-turn-helix domain-containing protein [Litchfieldia salsa]|uniref:DNA-binding transcriptional regulator, XRE family n=1 Tax=Litchfieldia salsa TaxID=930152 RepID=A0A1H0W684_9BACI|nr:helix-turn-helix transcriptional regulator [Litchfieldia salsa]SDP86219.1 DNA-binding transcriptional regulator, XRE family [Litchfieldia salsa]